MIGCAARAPDRPRRRRIGSGALFAALGLLALPAVAAPEPAALVDRLDASARSVQSLSGQFTQTSRLKLFRRELTSHGRFFFQRPRKVRWEYVDPDPSTLTLDGDRATLRTPGVAPQTFDLARDATMRAVFDQIFLWLGAGTMAQARADYDLSAGGSDAAPVLQLAPRPGSPVARAFARIELRFSRELLLRTILLREPSGDEKEIVFQRMERNPTLAADAFAP